MRIARKRSDVCAPLNTYLTNCYKSARMNRERAQAPREGARAATERGSARRSQERDYPVLVRACASKLDWEELNVRP